MRSALEGVGCGRNFATGSGHGRDRWYARSLPAGYLSHTGELRCSRTTCSPREKASASRACNLAVGGRLVMSGGRFLLVMSFLVLTGCTLGPKYKRPQVTVPDSYRGLAPGTDRQTVTSLGDEKWWSVYQDPQLQALIREALSQNYDVRIAAARVLQAQAVLGITRADQFPTITGGASTSNERAPATSIALPFETSPFQVNLSLFWELDFWGRFRRATEAARATVLATQWGQKAVV